MVAHAAIFSWQRGRAGVVTGIPEPDAMDSDDELARYLVRFDGDSYDSRMIGFELRREEDPDGA